MTSVKEFEVLTPPTPGAAGVGAFYFTDRYSIFDWGVMPDRLAEKGAVLCTMGAHTFERLEAAGITTTATWLGHRRTLWYCGVVWTVAAAAAGFDHLDGKIEALQISTMISATKLTDSVLHTPVGRYKFVGRVKLVDSDGGQKR